MCGRYTLTSSPAQLAEHFALDSTPTGLGPHFNIAPTQMVPVVREVAGLGRHLDFVRWGLIPSWSKDPKIGNRMINARAESLADKPAFRAAFRRRRCLVVADGFYEWKRLNGHKQPYWVGLQNRQPLAFAGLWEHWEAPDGSEVIESCTIVTTEANDMVSQLHARMPVILAPDAYAAWLDPAREAEEAAALLLPFPDADMIAYPVSREVNNPRNDHADLLLPVQPD